MRRLILIATFLALNSALFLLWQLRFEPIPGIRQFALEDLRPTTTLSPGASWIDTADGAVLSLKIGKDGNVPIALLQFPNLSPQQWLQVKIQTTALNLIAGHQYWKDGRCIMEWHTAGAKEPWENNQFSSVRNNQKTDVDELVLRPDRAPAYPLLRIENSGVSGEMRVIKFEAIAVQERLMWRIGRWLLALGWISWVVYLIGFNANFWVRPILAGFICLMMGIYFVVPGPWKVIRSFSQPFQIHPSSHEPTVKLPEFEEFTPLNPESSLGITRKPLESVERVVEKNDMALRLKLEFARFRPILHVLLLFFPTLVITCLVGKRPAIQLMVIMAILIEAAQVAFGYGFDQTDIVDLISDSIGIFVAVLVFAKIRQIRSPKLKALLDSHQPSRLERMTGNG